MIQQDLCNSHMSIASCTVERGQLVLGREGFRGSAWAKKGQERTETCDLFVK